MIKTVTTTAGVNTIKFESCCSMYYWVRNIGTDTLYVGTTADIAIDADDTAMLAAGESTLLKTHNNTVYVLGEGKVEIHESDTPVCPFKSGAKGGGSGGSGQGLVLLKHGDSAYTATSSYVFTVDGLNVSDYKMFVCIIKNIGSVAFTPEMSYVKFRGDGDNIYQVQWVHDNMFQIDNLSGAVLSYFSYQLFGVKG